MPRITDIYACVVSPGGDDEGILSMPSDIGSCPLLTGNPDRAAQVRLLGEKISRETSIPFRFLRFSDRKDVSLEDVTRESAVEPSRPYRIKELWAFLSDEGPGPEDEGIMASNLGGGPVFVPLVGADAQRVASYVDEAKLVSRVHGKSYKIARFKLAGEVTRRF